MYFLTLLSSVLLLICGFYLTIKSGCFQFLKFRNILLATFGKLIKDRDTEGFKAMSVALGSTIGIGNIVGVAAAICIGGPGAVFWMLVIGVIGMMTKYAEIYISSDEANKSGRNIGGPMYVFKTHFRGVLQHIGVVFAVSCVAASVFAGNISQSKALFEFSRLGFSADIVSVSIIILPLLFLIISGRDRVYKNFSAVFVPLMSFLYILAVIIIILRNNNNVLSALNLIIKSAFGFDAAAGGVSGFVLMSALKTGVMKGLFTNEAGMGSAPIAHCSSKKRDSHSQACWGIVEVFIDTVLVCMLTAVAIISSPAYLTSRFSDPFTLVCNVFMIDFGIWGIKILSLSAVCFAFAAIIGWSFYGIKSLEFLTNNIFVKKIFIILYVLCVPFSALVREDVMWMLTDIFNTSMLIPNSFLLLIEGGAVVKMLRIGSDKDGMRVVSKKMRGGKKRNLKFFRSM